jgi:hypothetical protein
MLHGNEL